MSWQSSAWIIIVPKCGSSSSWVTGLCCGWGFILFVCLFVVVVVVVVDDDDDVVGQGEATLISLRILLMGTVK